MPSCATIGCVSCSVKSPPLTWNSMKSHHINKNKLDKNGLVISNVDRMENIFQRIPHYTSAESILKKMWKRSASKFYQLLKRIYKNYSSKQALFIIFLKVFGFFSGHFSKFSRKKYMELEVSWTECSFTKERLPQFLKTPPHCSTETFCNHFHISTTLVDELFPKQPFRGVPWNWLFLDPER